jgi:hypothetical protein
MRQLIAAANAMAEALELPFRFATDYWQVDPEGDKSF